MVWVEDTCAWACKAKRGKIEKCFRVKKEWGGRPGKVFTQEKKRIGGVRRSVYKFVAASMRVGQRQASLQGFKGKHI